MHDKNKRWLSSLKQNWDSFCLVFHCGYSWCELLWAMPVRESWSTWERLWESIRAPLCSPLLPLPPGWRSLILLAGVHGTALLMARCDSSGSSCGHSQPRWFQLCSSCCPYTCPCSLSTHSKIFQLWLSLTLSESALFSWWRDISHQSF